ncbi:MAG: SDR family NAD(P)-dependent oxidoreductase [Deltaproteobacteria bacterium]|nr:SDR family NAD(P)-dependent oxidoreductase [Deltaproteobacteria bacterium]MBW2694317.1 SDR family NAD(P)-dependent oxidoreductase [Deltaproteobacteria bacterium]
MEINGASAIVTGGASGIGEAAARRLSALGARCVIVDLDEGKGKELASALGGEFAKADVSNAEEVQAAVDAAVALGPLRVLVNSAGVGSIGRTVDREGNPFDLDAFERVLRINLTGSFNCLRLAAAAMARMDPVDAEGQRGAIVNMASAAAFDGQTGQAAYSASKGGVVGMTLPIARDLRAIGVRVNTIAPGLIDTPIYGEGEGSEKFKTHLAQNVVFPKRLGYADEIASMVVELVTNDYMNAEVVRVDGGVRLPPK